MHRFFLPPDQCHAPVLSLRGAEAHHASNVLRIQRGDRITVLDGEGTEYACEIRNCYRGQVDLEVREKRSVPPLPWRITLLQALPRGKLVESIIQKAAELGVARVVPLLSERVVVHLGPAAAEEKRAKWQGVAMEAVKQCGSAWLPRVEMPLTPRGFLDRKEPFELAFVGSLQPSSRHPREYIRLFERCHQRRPGSICIWVGPEGDFAPTELEMIEAAGAKPISLGRLVLRCETAAIYCLSIVNYELSAPTA